MADDSSVTTFDGLDNTFPDGATQSMNVVDNQIRMLKNVLLNMFSGLASTPVTSTAAELNLLAGKSLASSDNVIDNFPANLIMLFRSTNAPTGWTKESTYNDYNLRVVTGSASQGGSVAFSTLFARTATDSHTLTSAESGLPAHTHATSPAVIKGLAGSGSSTTTGGTQAQTQIAIAANSAANASSGHTHNLDMRVKYLDVIMAKKD